MNQWGVEKGYGTRVFCQLDQVYGFLFDEMLVEVFVFFAKVQRLETHYKVVLELLPESWILGLPQQCVFEIIHVVAWVFHRNRVDLAEDFSGRWLVGLKLVASKEFFRGLFFWSIDAQ